MRLFLLATEKSKKRGLGDADDLGDDKPTKFRIP